MQIKYSDLRKSSPLPSEKFDFLAGESLNFSKEKLLMISNSLELSPIQLKKIKKNQALTLAGTPPEYIFKKAYFAENKFYVDENVLIPRPETEILIQEAASFLINRKNSKILDLGTGCGCIAISLKKIFHNAEIIASDISSDALKIAKKNAKAHKTKINFIKSDLLQNIDQKFDLICTNLPYIDPTDPDFKKLADPKIALDGGKDGFELIEKFLLKLPNHLTKNGIAILEIGHNQEKLIKKCAKNIGFKCKIKNDLNNFARIALISKK